ncbi:MAG: hypothetical protein CME69_10970 [Halobacteriovorax sp.]|nr:hypothetical protein [Halobacteriovorax sp.]
MNSQSEKNTQFVYKIGLNHIFLMICFSVIALLYGFISNFSLEAKIESLVDSNLKKVRRCPISYKKLTLSYIFPGISFRNLELDGACFKGSDGLMLNNVETSLGFPSFSPLGPSLNTTIKDKYSLVNISSAHSVSSHKIRIESNKLSSKTFDSLLNDFKVEGLFKLTSVSELTKKNLKSLLINLKSNNLVIPSQTINSFDIPKLDVKNFSLIAELSGKDNLNIKKFVVGDERSPLRANIEGKVTLNTRRIQNSELDLNIVVKFSEQFLESFGIISLFLDSSKQDENGFYTINVKGPLSRPKHTVIKK